MTITALDHVQVTAPAGCEAEARRFYGELLGLPETPKLGETARRGGVWFRAGGQELHIGVEDDFRPQRKGHPAFLLPDAAAVEALADRLAAAGCEIEWNEEIPGRRRFYTRDPWRNRVELMSISAEDAD